MILELLILLVILWIVTGSTIQSHLHNYPDVSNKLDSVKFTLHSILNKENLNLPFNVYPSKDRTYVQDKSNIYLVLTKDDGSFYDDNTIMHAAIHELAHIACPPVCTIEGCDDHPPLFDVIEGHFLQIAEKIGVYNPKKPLDPTYPCEDLVV